MGACARVKRTAVVLLNLGGPSSPKEIKPFLFSLFYDVLRVPNPFRYGLAQAIAQWRLPKAQRLYARLGGASPLLKNTQDQATALEATLGKGFRVFVAMRHAAPLTTETVRAVKAYAPQAIVLLPLYPHYSATTTGSSLKEWGRIAQKQGLSTPPRVIPCYPAEDGFLEALKERTLPAYQEAQKQGVPRLLMTAHSLPERVIQQGDPYQRQVERTAQKFLEKLKIAGLESVLCYQSRIGPLKWIGPSTQDEIITAARAKRPLVIVPISFVSEHVETLVELDILYRDLALQEGCPAYFRVKTVQTHPSFIEGLATLVKKETRDAF